MRSLIGIVQQRCVYFVELEPIINGYCHFRYLNFLLNVQNEIFSGSIGFSFKFSQEMIIQLNKTSCILTYFVLFEIFIIVSNRVIDTLTIIKAGNVIK